MEGGIMHLANNRAVVIVHDNHRVYWYLPDKYGDIWCPGFFQ